MSYSIKDEIHQLIDKCEEEAVLYEIKDRLKDNEKDWWDELSKEEQEEILESDRQVQAGNFYTHEEVKQLMKRNGHHLYGHYKPNICSCSKVIRQSAFDCH